jgi:hypothetical protein
METSALSGDGPEKGAFVVLDGTGIAERGFATLAEAVFAARDGDTIEVRASGPFVTQPLFPKGNALTIRAADGHRPVFTVRAEGARPFLPLLHTNAPLTLEGLEFHRHDAQEWEPLTSPPKLIVSRGAPLHAANCRFVFKTPGVVELLGSPIGNFRNCEFISTSRIFWMGGVACDSPAGSRLQMHNCVIAGGGAGLALWHSKPKSDDVEVQLTRNTLTRGVAVAFCLNSVPDDAASDGQPPQPPFRIHSAHNVFDVQAAVLRFEQGPLYLKQAKEPLTSGDAERLLPRLVAWHEQGSRFSLGSAEWLTFSELGQLRPLEHPITSAADWQRFWGGRPETVAAGRVRFQGGNVRQKAITVPDLVNREDFRLRGGSGEDPGAPMLTSSVPGKPTSAGSARLSIRRGSRRRHR